MTLEGASAPSFFGGSLSKFFDYNPDKGMWIEEDYDHTTDTVILHHKQDLQPVLDYAKEERNSGINDKVGDLSKYAIIPAHVEIALRKKGINMYDPRQTRELLKEIETNYPRLKYTNLRHAV
jgi:hypothetical protein